MTVLPVLRRALNLRILFCGSDGFSATSLARLRSEMESNPETISSIEVLCRLEKPSGRGMKSQRGIPTKQFAEKNEMTLHQIKTFTEWELPSPVDLIIAVSFGLFIPPRILGAAKYGGINVHPSLLPKYRGAAPIHRAIINGDAYTGVTVQTLDPNKFDHGRILAQSRRMPIDYSKFGVDKFSWTERRVRIPLPKSPAQEHLPEDPFQVTQGILGEEGAGLLVDVVRKGLFLPLDNEPPSAPEASSDATPSTLHLEEPSTAGKLEKDEARLILEKHTPSQAIRLSWVMGHVYCWFISPMKGKQTKRVLLYALEEVAKPEGEIDLDVWDNSPPGTYFALKKFYIRLKPNLFDGLDKRQKKNKSKEVADDERAVIKVKDGWISCRRAQLEGGKPLDGTSWVRSYKYDNYELKSEEPSDVVVDFVKNE